MRVCLCVCARACVCVSVSVRVRVCHCCAGHTHVEESLECSTPYGDGYVEDRRGARVRRRGAVCVRAHALTCVRPPGMDGILVVRLAYGRAFLQVCGIHHARARCRSGCVAAQASVVQWKKILPTAGVEVEGTRSGV